jgi:formylglycine-generating enzyme required for sulfatase activity
VSQETLAGKERHPVTGVSWHEATAFCAARGKRLPTLYEWEKAARDGRVSPTGVVLPWGPLTAEARHERRANFAGPGTLPVDAFPYGISPYGAYGMAGNVKEWLANPVDDGYGSGRVIRPTLLGGGRGPATEASTTIGRCPHCQRHQVTGSRPGETESARGPTGRWMPPTGRC